MIAFLEHAISLNYPLLGLARDLRKNAVVSGKFKVLAFLCEHLGCELNASELLFDCVRLWSSAGIEWAIAHGAKVEQRYLEALVKGSADEASVTLLLNGGAQVRP